LGKSRASCFLDSGVGYNVPVVVQLMLFVTVLFTVTFGMTDSMMYYFTDAVTETFINERADAYNSDSSFREIDEIDDWYNVSMVTHAHKHNHSISHFLGLSGSYNAPK